MQIRKWSFFVLPRKVNGTQYQVVVGNVTGFEKKEKEEEQEEEEEEEEEEQEKKRGISKRFLQVLC